MGLAMGVRPGGGSRGPVRAGLAITASLVLLAGFVTTIQLVPVTRASVSSLAVYVGYADDIDENGAQISNPSYPFPWCNSANVIVMGDCSYVDGGTVMIVNIGTVPAVVDNVSVFLPANNTMIVYNSEAYDGEIQIEAGHAVVLSTTASSYPNPSHDTSQYSSLAPCSTPLVGGQTAPQVILGIGRVNTTFIDTNHVIDTGGSDLGACNGADETTQWQQVFRPGTPASKTSQSLQPIGGSYGSQAVSGTAWNFTNSNVCGKPGTTPQCEGAAIGLEGLAGLHMLDGNGSPVAFSGTVLSSGIALGGCQKAFRNLPTLKMGTASVASCFDTAIVTTGTLVGNVSITAKVTFPLSVAGPGCKFLKLQISYLQNKKVYTDGGLSPTTSLGTNGGKITCGITVGQDASILGTSALGAAGHTAFTVTQQTPTTATCHSPPVAIAAWVSCKVIVWGKSPTGTVNWVNDGSPGTFRVSACTLAKGLTRSACAISYKQTSLSTPVVLTASYGGDINNGANSSVFQLSVKQRASVTKVACTPTSLPANSIQPFNCTARVNGYVPTGTVSFSVGFSSTKTCNLIGNSCTVQLFPGGVGHWKLTVNYQGDLNNIGSVAYKYLNVIP